VVYVEGREVSSFLTLTSQFGTQEHPVSIFTDHVLVGWNREREKRKKRRNLNPSEHIRT
jgi:hypothetical protein